MLKKKYLKGVLNYDALLISSTVIFLSLPHLLFKGKSSKLSICTKNVSIFHPFDVFHCLNQSWKITI